ncbi:unnamed protein product, partial [Mesorhabditis belari]|uniref:Uncharacterized protein n=1 Tax=Mesorhabditis belari TaxID=2138241 RepID=A0AAF3EG54_9BILA
MLLYFSKEFEDDLLKFDETLHPSCAFMNKQYQGRKELECTTLRSMGLGSGKVLIRFNRILCQLWRLHKLKKGSNK